MTRIDIKGLLVGPDYDDPVVYREVDRGVFAPSSKFLRELKAANGDDIEVHIDSEGGDVFAWNGVANALKEYPGDVKIVIGACAFSEAANLALTCGRPIYVHPNSIMLWHSAMSTVFDGAAGELKAEAEMLERINAPVKAELVRHGIPKEQVEEGFRDGGALVLGAEELIQYGIAIPYTFEGADERFQKRDEEISKRLVALAEASQRIAAHYHSTHQVNKIEMKAEEIKEPLEEEQKPVEEEQPTSEEKKETPCAEEEKPEEEAPSDETHEETEEEEAPVNEDEPQEEEKPEETEEQAEEDDEDKVVETLEILKENLDTLASRVNALEEKLTEKEVELQDAKKALKAERSKRINAISAAVSGKADVGPKDWREAVKACKGDKLEAYKRYPDLAKAWAKQ